MLRICRAVVILRDVSYDDFIAAVVLNVGNYSSAARTVFGAFDVHCFIVLVHTEHMHNFCLPSSHRIDSHSY